LLKENNLCDTLDDAGATFTLFAPINSAFHEFDDLDLSPFVELDIKTVLLNHVVSGSAFTVDALDCGESIAMLSGETTQTRCESEKARRVLATDFQTVKFQFGKGNDKSNLKPELWPTFLKTKNGNILEVDEVLIPELRVPTKSPTKKPTPAPTVNPTKNPTPAPTDNPTKNPTKNPTPAPTACTVDSKIFFYGGDATKNCPFVTEKPEKRCLKKGAKEACCATCANF
jgi:hypothetical protein